MRPFVQLKNLEVTRHQAIFNCSLGMINLSSQDIPDIKDIFNEEEILYIKNLNERRKQSFTIGRYLTKVLIGNYFNETDLKKIVIKAGVFGQPLLYISGHAIESLNISISHTKEVTVAIAFPNHHLIGIDVEKMDFESVSNFSNQLTDHEVKIFDNSEEENIFYTRMWTIKEALSKAIKTGLTVPLQVFEVHQIIYYDNFTISTFTNFTQYKALSILLKDNVFTIVLPKHSFFCPTSLIDFFTKNN